MRDATQRSSAARAPPLTRDGTASGAWYEFDAQDPADGSSFTFNVRAFAERLPPARVLDLGL